MTLNKIKVLIVDDSALIRQTISLMLKEDLFIEVVGTAFNPFFAIKKIEDLEPDVILLDIQMPKMDGLTFLQKLMQQKPMKVIIFSSYVEDGSYNALKALELGAIDVIEKPRISSTDQLERYKDKLIKSIKIASIARVKKYTGNIRIGDIAAAKVERPVLKFDPSIEFKISDFVIAIGASTGGTEAIRVVLENLPDNLPPIVITQHMPVGFTNSFAKRLNQLSKLTVKEAENNDVLEIGHAYIARGDRHLVISKYANKFTAILNDDLPVNRHKPSVDVLFNSVAKAYGKNAIGVILTGMGDDGSSGMKTMHDNGAQTIAQNEESCVVFGMPKVAISKKGVDHILPISEIGDFIVNLLNKTIK